MQQYLGKFCLAAATAALALTATLPSLHAGDKKEAVAPYAVADRQERIKIDVTRDRNMKQDGYGSRQERVQFKVKLTNQDTVKEFKDLKAKFIVIAQNMADRKRFVALQAESFDVKLGKGTSDRELLHESREVMMDSTDSRKPGGYYLDYGDKYDGWILAILDEDDKIVAFKTSKESYTQNIGKISGIKEKSWFDLKLDATEAGMATNNSSN
jgi:hypothetical protein